MAEGGNKIQSSRGNASKDSKKATTDDEGRKLTKLKTEPCTIYGGRHERWTMQTMQTVQPWPLALKLAKVYKPCALVVKKTELMEGVADTHGIRPRRKEDIVDWLIRVLYKLEYYDHGLLTYAGVVTLLEKHE